MRKRKQVQRKSGDCGPAGHGHGNPVPLPMQLSAPGWRRSAASDRPGTILRYAAFGGEADLATLAETARGPGQNAGLIPARGGGGGGA